VLVDTSVWSLSFRRKAANLNPTEESIVRELTELIKEGRARLIGPIRQELLSGIRTAQQYGNLLNELRTFPDEVVHTSDYESAAKISNIFISKGLAASGVDALICAVAIDRNFSIFTTDPDFLNFTKAVSIRLHRPRR
jgi:predicted nucleic acid-binding protein